MAAAAAPRRPRLHAAGSRGAAAAAAAAQPLPQLPPWPRPRPKQTTYLKEPPLQKLFSRRSMKGQTTPEVFVHALVPSHVNE